MLFTSFWFGAQLFGTSTTKNILLSDGILFYQTLKPGKLRCLFVSKKLSPSFSKSKRGISNLALLLITNLRVFRQQRGIFEPDTVGKSSLKRCNSILKFLILCNYSDQKPSGWRFSKINEASQSSTPSKGHVMINKQLITFIRLLQMGKLKEPLITKNNKSWCLV